MHAGMRATLILLFTGMFQVAMVPALKAADITPDKNTSESVSTLNILTDFFIVRPIAVAGLIAAVPVASLAVPASALFGNSREVSKELLGKPFHHAFRRHLGDFREE